jgi:hypothetical protein
MRALMHKYRDHPMDLADASLVRLAEERHLRDIFTLDQSDFGTYRIHGRQAFRLWPNRHSCEALPPNQILDAPGGFD